VNVGVAILGLAVLILIHEAGHFYVARAVGMRPRKFYIGFPPALVKVRRKGIEYGLGSIPLGGYVKIPGMHRPAPSDLDVHLGRAIQEEPLVLRPAEHVKRALAEGDMTRAAEQLPELERAVERAEVTPAARRTAERGLRELRDGLGTDAYWRQRTWKKVAVIFAGPATNLVFAVVLFSALLMQDAYQVGIRLAADENGAATTRIESVLAGRPAERAGLRAGDRIVAVDGARVDSQALLERIDGSRGRPLRFTVERDGARVAVGPVRARKDPGASGPEAVWDSLRITYEVSKAVAGFFPRLVGGEGREEVSSPVGIVQGSSRALDQGVENYLFVLGLISLSLALLNLLPLLPLDGGHIMFSLIEGIRGRAVGREVYERVSVVGIAVVLMLFFIGLSNDIGRLGGG